MRESAKWVIYLVFSIVLGVFAVFFLSTSLSYMERAMIGSSLLSALIGFTLLSSSLYALRISAYVYSLIKGSENEARKS